MSWMLQGVLLCISFPFLWLALAMGALGFLLAREGVIAILNVLFHFDTTLYYSYISRYLPMVALPSVLAAGLYCIDRTYQQEKSPIRLLQECWRSRDGKESHGLVDQLRRFSMILVPMLLLGFALLVSMVAILVLIFLPVELAARSASTWSFRPANFYISGKVVAIGYALLAVYMVLHAIVLGTFSLVIAKMIIYRVGVFRAILLTWQALRRLFWAFLALVLPIGLILWPLQHDAVVVVFSPLALSAMYFAGRELFSTPSGDKSNDPSNSQSITDR